MIDWLFEQSTGSNLTVSISFHSDLFSASTIEKIRSYRFDSFKHEWDMMTKLDDLTKETETYDDFEEYSTKKTQLVKLINLYKKNLRDKVKTVLKSILPLTMLA